MRMLPLSLLLTLAHAATALAQEHGAATEAPAPLMALRLNLMLWTLVIFGILFFLLKRYAFPAIIGAVEKNRLETYVPSSFRPAVVVRHLVPGLFRYGTAKSFTKEIAEDRRKR